jgi:hypothetical protein
MYQLSDTWLNTLDQDKLARTLSRFAREQPEWVRENNNDPAFGLWMWFVNRSCLKLAGVSINDLPDWNSHANFTSGQAPSAAAMEQLRELMATV